MSLLAQVVAACDEELRAHAVSDLPDGRFDGLLEDQSRAFTLEAVFEGYLLHYDSPRAFTGMDADLRLLAGDALYALGLARVAECGDLLAVAELADLISLCAQAEAEGRREVIGELWAASAAALSGAGGGGVRQKAVQLAQGS